LSLFQGEFPPPLLLEERRGAAFEVGVYIEAGGNFAFGKKASPPPPSQTTIYTMQKKRKELYGICSVAGAASYSGQFF
jgi:hypothetical protein